MRQFMSSGVHSIVLTLGSPSEGRRSHHEFREYEGGKRGRIEFRLNIDRITTTAVNYRFGFQRRCGKGLTSKCPSTTILATRCLKLARSKRTSGTAKSSAT